MARNPDNLTLKLIHRQDSIVNVPEPTIKTRWRAKIHPFSYLCPEVPKVKFGSGNKKGIADEVAWRISSRLDFSSL